MAVPGFLLSGWAPVRATARPVQIVVRDLTSRADETLRQGVAFGMAEVNRVAQMTQAPVTFERLDRRGVPPMDAGVEVIVRSSDDCGLALPDVPGLTRIYTCPLEEWRPDAWSVASRRVDDARTAPTSDWHPALTRSGAAQLNARFLQETGVPMDEGAWRGWMAVKVAYESGLRARSGEDDLLALEFDGYKGQPLRFAEDGHLRQPTFRVDGDARLVMVPPHADLDDLHG